MVRKGGENLEGEKGAGLKESNGVIGGKVSLKTECGLGNMHTLFWEV